MKKFLLSPLMFIVFLGLFIRILTIFWAFEYRENTDILRWKDWGRIAYLYGFADTYKTDHLTFGTLANNVPPGEAYIIFAMYQANIVTTKIVTHITHVQPNSTPWLNGEQLTFFLRLPSILADIIITLFIYKIINRLKDKKSALLASIFFYCNPVVIYNSALWGQTDALINVFFIVGLYFFMRKKYIATIIFYALSLFIKLSLIIYLPLLVLILFLQNKKRTIAGWGIALLLILIATLPVSISPLVWWLDFLKSNAVGEMQNITAYAFNFWWVVYHPWISIGKPSTLFNFSEVRLIGSPDTNVTHISSLPVSIIGYILFIVSLLPFIYGFIKHKTQRTFENIILVLIISALCGFLFLPRMHERYLYPLFPLFAMYIYLEKHRAKLLIIFFIITFCNILNVYIVWHPMLLLPYQLINNQVFQWSISVCLVIVGITFYIMSVRKLLFHEKVSKM